MEIKITGASGYIGEQIKRQLNENGHNASGISRGLLYGKTGELKKEISGCDVIINLAGSPILQHWTKKNKKIIYESRIKTTENLVKAINELKHAERPKRLISASATGIYQVGESHDETSTNLASSFVGDITKSWEKALMQLPSDVQKIVFRIGAVLGKKSKVLKYSKIAFKLGLGATIGTGHQPFPFIHEEDLVKVFVWSLEKLRDSGEFNVVAPDTITNKDFTIALARQLNRTIFLTVPDFILKLIWGEAASLLLESPTVIPKSLIDNGFDFKYPTIELALREILT